MCLCYCPPLPFQESVGITHKDANAAGYQQMRYAKEAGNRKIFRDLINEHYDPFELEKAGIHYSTKKLLDPMKHDLEKV
jgi:hypothetical protein